MRNVLVLLLLLLSSPSLLATPEVSVVGLFGGKAVLVIEGRRQLLAVGETSAEGIRLVSADSRSAVVDIAGTSHRLTLSRKVGGTYRRAQHEEVRVARGRSGLFATTGTINGISTDFLVDTGASAVAMDIASAERFGIAYRKGTPVSVQTANGITRAYKLLLDEVTVGGIRVSSVAAVVIEGPAMQTPLLGMSFLGRVALRNEGALLVLRQAR